MTMSATKRRRLIYVQRRVDGVDSLNQPLSGFETILTLWAHIRGQNGMAAVRGMEEGIDVATTRYSFRIKYRPTGLDDDMIVLYAGREYAITDIRHDHDGHVWTDVVCEARQ